MAKEKVYKLAQEFKVSSEALVQMLRGMGIPVKSHMSTVDENLRGEIKKKFEQERAEIKKEYRRKKQMLARAREDMVAKSEKADAAKSDATSGEQPTPAAAKAEPRPSPSAAQSGAPETTPSRPSRGRRRVEGRCCFLDGQRSIRY
mgnify:FL=1